MVNIEKLDPRQSLALQYYRNPESETFSDLKNSMIRAGFKETYSDVITGQKPAWLTASIEQDIENVKLVEKNINKYLSYDVDLNKLDEKHVMDILKLQHDMTKFTAKSILKSKYGGDSEEKETSVQINIVNYSDTKPQEARTATITDIEV